MHAVRIHEDELCSKLISSKYEWFKGKKPFKHKQNDKFKFSIFQFYAS